MLFRSTDISKLPEDTWVACDARHAPEGLAESIGNGDYFAGRKTFLLTDELLENLPDTITQVMPACDFFQLDCQFEEGRFRDPPPASDVPEKEPSESASEESSKEAPEKPSVQQQKSEEEQPSSS